MVFTSTKVNNYMTLRMLLKIYSNHLKYAQNVFLDGLKVDYETGSLGVKICYHAKLKENLVNTLVCSQA